MVPPIQAGVRRQRGWVYGFMPVSALRVLAHRAVGDEALTCERDSAAAIGRSLTPWPES